MPAEYWQTYPVRHYECDAHGHLNNAVYVRWMQEAAYGASAAVGYDMVGYRSLGSLWYIRQSEIEYLLPVLYGDVITIKTWVADFHRVRSLRAYEFYRQSDQRLVARGWSDWVYLHAETQQPLSIPPAMAQAFWPEGQPPASRRTRFPAPPPPPAAVFVHQRSVEWRDLDPLNHVNNATYFSYIEECGQRASAAFGWTMERMRAHGFAILARKHRIEYRQPALPGDTLNISTWVSGLRGASATRHYLIERAADGALLALNHTLHVWVNRQTGTPIRIPRLFMDDFSANQSPAAWAGD